MILASQLQQLEFVRALLRSQDEAGTVPPATADENSSPDTKRAALLAGACRPPCACDPANGPVPCDAAILAVLSQEPVPGCPNIGKPHSADAE